MNPRRPASQRGVGLIDVLIGLAVVGIGIAGLVQFQALVSRETAAVRARGLALQLAQGKLDELRGYSQSEAGGAGVYGYDELADDRGGVETGNSLLLPSGEIQLDHMRYLRRWTVVPYSFCAGVETPQPGDCAASRPRPDHKLLQVTLSWTEHDGSARTLSLMAGAAAIDPVAAGSALWSAGPLPPSP